MKAAGFDFLAASSPAAATLLREFAPASERNDIEKKAGNAGVCEVGGDAGAHRSGAEDRNFSNWIS